MPDPQQHPDRPGPLAEARTAPRHPAAQFRLFGQTPRTYRQAYARLEAEFAALSAQLDETNQQLRRSLEEKDRISGYLTDVLDSLSSGVVAVDPTGTVTLFNRAAERIVGCTRQQALGRPYAAVIGDGEAGTSALLRTLQTGVCQRTGEKSVTRADGRQVPLGYSTSLVRDAGGRVLGAVEVFDDLTEVKELEAQLRRAHTLSALGEMAATVAHEIRNPLGGIATFASLLERQLAPDAPQRRLVERISEGVGRLNRIVTSLLDCTRPLRLQPRPVNLIGLVEEAVRFFEAGLTGQTADTGARICVVRRYSGHWLPCRLDVEQFQQVLTNLLRNAAQAMPAGGSIEVSVVPGANGGGPAVAVCDSGPGLAEAVLEKLFSPFFTTKADGTGLGLVTCRRIVEAHGGRIWAENAPGAGARFVVALPASCREAAEP